MSVNVSTDAMVTCANDFDKVATSISQDLADAVNAVKSLYNSWSSPAGSAFREKYYSFNSSAETTCPDLVKSYAVLLRTCALQGYETAEKKLTETASKFD